MTEVKNKVVWITGASSGIGEALAIEFALKGAKLVLSARRESELNRVMVTTGLDPANILVLPLDMTDHDLFESKITQIINKFGRIDILVNNAGISQRGDVLNSDISVFKSLMDLNFFAVVALTKAVLPFFLKQNSGKFVVTSSVSGKLGSPKRAGYSASKHALHGFFDSLRAEVHNENVSVLMVCPGYIKTNISKNALGQNGQLHGKMDANQENGLDANVCARKIISGIEKNKAEIYIGGKEILGIYLKRFLPNLLNRIVIKQAPK